MQKIKLSLKKIYLKNFKIYSEQVFEFDKKTEIYGDNAAGKTSIIEAVQFCFYGSKKDMGKIKVGENDLKVVATFVSDTGLTVNISASLDKENDKHKVTVLFNGQIQKSPTKLLKQLIGVESFDPRLLLEPKGRTERLLKMIPISLSQDVFKDIKIPEGTNLDYSKHGFDVLSELQKALEKERGYLYRERMNKSRTFNELSVRAGDRQSIFQKMHGKEVHEIERRDDLDDKRQKIHERYNEDINKLNKKMFEIKEAIRDKEIKLQKDLRAIDDEKSIIVEADDIKKDIALQDKMRVEYEDAYGNYNEVDVYLKINLKEIKEELLKPITKSITGLSLNEDNELLLNGKSLDEISESEGLRLAIEFLKIKETNSLVCIDGAESISEENLNKIDWKDLDVILVRVAKKSLNNKDFKSIEVQYGQ